MQVTLLGTGGPLVADRATTGMIVTAPGCSPLLIDTCGGFELAHRLRATGFSLSDIRFTIVTHRHLDHAGGVQALLLARIALEIFATADTHDGIRAVTAGCFPEWELHPQIARREISDGVSCEIGGFRVTFFAVRHRVPTVAVRLSHGGRIFAFSADSIPCDELTACARDADLFLCDAICAEADGKEAVARSRTFMHATAREAAMIAHQAGVRTLACTHIGRFGNADNILTEAQAYFKGPVSVPDDGAVYDV